MGQLLSKVQFDTEAVREALHAILASTTFVGSPQLSAFLNYVVQQTLDGRGSTLKAYSIATEALGRPSSFDPVTDATVRVLAGRVRSALELYYSRQATCPGVVIELLPGSYAPRFRIAAAGTHQSVAETGDVGVVIRPKEFLPLDNTATGKNRAAHRLLILEDNSELRPVLHRIGTDSGYVVVEAAQANEFWLAYHALKPTHIILDLILPGADGLEIMRELGRLSAKCHITLLSGVDPRVLRTAERLGREIGLNIAGAVSKPFDVDQICTLLASSRATAETIDLDELARAITSDQFVLHYQPKISWNNNGQSSLDGIEGLVRWNHPTRGLVLPSEILPAAEAGNLLIPLTHRVVDIAIAQLATLNPLYPHLNMSINVPANVFADPSFPDFMAAHMDTAGLKRNRLVIEISESIANNEALGPNDALVRLGMKGFTLSMDDFGSGNSSLLRLLRMPFSELKIDRYFVQESKFSEEARTIVQTIIGLAQNLKMRPCAVGIEDTETLTLLRSLGCTLAQGNLFSKPASAVELDLVLSRVCETRW